MRDTTCPKCAGYGQHHLDFKAWGPLVMCDLCDGTGTYDEMENADAVAVELLKICRMVGEGTTGNPET